MPKRVAVYVDGFNLYHAIDELRDNQLKWLDLWQLPIMIKKFTCQLRLYFIALGHRIGLPYRLAGFDRSSLLPRYH